MLWTTQEIVFVYQSHVSKRVDKEGYHCKATAPQDGFCRDMDDIIFFFLCEQRACHLLSTFYSPLHGVVRSMLSFKPQCAKSLQKYLSLQSLLKETCKLNLMVSHSHYKSLLFLLCKRDALSLKKAMCLNHVGCIFVFLLLIIICLMVIFC